MRRLHPVSDEERVVAQGEHQYLRAGEPTETGEQWELTRRSDGCRIHRVEVGDGEGLWHLILESDGRPDRLQVRLRDEAGRRFDATYTFFEDEVMVVGGQVGLESKKNVVELPPRYGLVSAPFAGRELRLLGYDPEAGPQQTITQYLLRQRPSDEGWLSGRPVECMLEDLGESELEVPAGTFEAREVQFTTPDLPRQRGWFDRHGTLLRWQSGDRVQAVLSRYRRFDGG